MQFSLLCKCRYMLKYQTSFLQLHRLPAQWVREYGNDLPLHCTLSMENGKRWVVTMIEFANGCYFMSGWEEFVKDNYISHGDALTFTHIGAGEFHVMRYDSKNGCPHRDDCNVWDPSWEGPAKVEPDLDTSDDYESFEDELSDDSGAVHNPTHEVLGMGVIPQFSVMLKKTKYEHSLLQKFPSGFCKKHLSMISSACIGAYFTVEDQTWQMVLRNKNGKIRTKRGWKRFMTNNRVRAGMRCTFQLIDVDEVQFYVTFEL
ncbi:uncharacterized protein LOC121798782 isoform X1 [Salvia splendens]|uniref:uncharacterized protein LOC121798782 isoform X1 n=2 Tax=Salvia splendens TaxID=180675 RepID=UPI001C27CCE8|nr:uncharacterized protein LOC121798782 isoform X1 [Salvia splendens]